MDKASIKEILATWKGRDLGPGMRILRADFLYTKNGVIHVWCHGKQRGSSWGRIIRVPISQFIKF